ncbi:MAG: outer membrane protein transport protein [Elusimicrobiota bacterium]
MKKLFSLIVSISLLVSLASPVFSGGAFVSPGTRANGMGGAYVAIADDETAIFWNPAGLAQLEYSGVQASGFYTNAKIKSNKSVRNAVSLAPDQDGGDFPVPNFYGLANFVNPGVPNMEPAEFTGKETEINSFLPFVAGYKAVNDWIVAVGFYVAGGGAGKWVDASKSIDGIDDINSKIESQFGYVVGNISAGRELSDSFSLGLGLNLIYLMDDMTVEKEYLANTGSVFGAGGGYSLKNDFSATGIGLEFVSGAMYKTSDVLQFGLVVKTGAKVSVEGTAKKDVEGLTALSGGLLIDGKYETDYAQNYSYPLTLGFGVAYDPAEALTLSAGANFNNYSVLKKDVNYTDDTVFPDEDRSLGWTDTTEIHAGAELRTSEVFALRAGFFTDPNPISGDKLTLLNTNQYDLYAVTGGFGYKIGLFKLDATYAYFFNSKPEKDGYTYEYPLDYYRLSLSYGF